jgi:hypothetical protein
MAAQPGSKSVLDHFSALGECRGDHAAEVAFLAEGKPKSWQRSHA